MLAAVRRRIYPLHFGALTAAFSSTTSTPSSNTTVSYLISSCGLSPTIAARAAKRVRLDSPGAAAKADTVLALLRSNGFTDADISSAIRQVPVLLTTDPSKTLQPKLDFFASVGIETPLLRRLVSLNPVILCRSVKNHLEPLFASLREALGSDARVVAALHRGPFAIRCDPKSSLFLTLPLLRDVHGLSTSDVSKLVAHQPGVILMPPDRINEIVDVARKFGVKPGDPMFTEAFFVLSKMKIPTLESKVALYERLGFHMDAVTLMIRRYPLSVAISEKNILEKVSFLTEKAGVIREDIVTYPTILARSLGTLSWKCAVLAVLRRAGKQQQHRLPVVLHWPKKRFLKEYVKPHMEEVPDVLRAMRCEIPFQGFDSLEEKPKLSSKKKMRA